MKGEDMSAITGIYHFNQEPIAVELCNGMMDSLGRYPVDAIGMWKRENLFLGCHTQWITPESIGERLPIYDQKNKLVILSDAVIDNRHELFERLQVEHSRRKELSDNQLILMAYAKWEKETPKYLIGSFAFMIWDENKQSLFGARDFSGSRTLYFHRTNDKFAFCTIIQPLLKLPHVKKSLNEEWLAEFLAIRGMGDSVSSFSTAYKNIEQVPPSHTIVVENGRVKVERYVTLTVESPLKLKSNEEYEASFLEVFQEAVTARLRTNREVGSYLSGGLDSGSVVSFAAKELCKNNKQLHTFSYIPAEGFKDWTPSYRMADERPFINSTVQYIGNINASYLDFKGSSPLSEIDEMLDVMEMPYKFLENSFWVKGTYEKARENGIGVLLSGARGNMSISWGPALDYYAILLKKMNWYHLYHEVLQYSKNIGVPRSRIMKIVWKKAFPFINQKPLLKDQYQFPILISPELVKKTNVYDRLGHYGISSEGDLSKDVNEIRHSHYEQLFSWNATGTCGTKLSLRYGLRGRDPTNDIRVIRFCLSLPFEQYVQNGLDRALIRRATKNYLPDKVRLNQKIRGIQGADGLYRMIPHWQSFIEEVEKLSNDPIVAEFFNVATIRDAISSLRSKPNPDMVFSAEFKILMRSLTVYRFIQKFV